MSNTIPPEEGKRLPNDMEMFVREAEDNYSHQKSEQDDYRAGAIDMYWQMISMDRWIPVSERLPDVGENILVRTEYMRNNNLTHEMFYGYLSEDGDLFTLPEEDSYGWTFAECVTHWKIITPPNI